MDVTYLTTGDAIAIHEDAMKRLGYPPEPLRDDGALASAVMRPRNAAYYEGADLVQQAALLAVGITQAQAFVDGNKRTAFQCLDTFLWINGVEFVGSPMELADWLVSTAERSRELKHATQDLSSWLRGHVRPR